MLITYVHMSIIKLYHVNVTNFLLYLSPSLFMFSSGGFILVQTQVKVTH